MRQLERVVTLPGALSIQTDYGATYVYVSSSIIYDAKDTSLLQTTWCGPAVSVIQRFHCISIGIALKGYKICPLYRGCLPFESCIIRGFTLCDSSLHCIVFTLSPQNNPIMSLLNTLQASGLQPPAP